MNGLHSQRCTVVVAIRYQTCATFCSLLFFLKLRQTAKVCVCVDPRADSLSGYGYLTRLGRIALHSFDRIMTQRRRDEPFGGSSAVAITAAATFGRWVCGWKLEGVLYSTWLVFQDTNFCFIYFSLRKTPELRQPLVLRSPRVNGRRRMETFGLPY